MIILLIIHPERRLGVICLLYKFYNANIGLLYILILMCDCYR